MIYGCYIAVEAGCSDYIRPYFNSSAWYGITNLSKVTVGSFAEHGTISNNLPETFPPGAMSMLSNDSKTYSWYNTQSSGEQFNYSGREYFYLAIG